MANAFTFTISLLLTHASLCVAATSASEGSLLPGVLGLGFGLILGYLVGSRSKGMPMRAAGWEEANRYADSPETANDDDQSRLFLSEHEYRVLPEIKRHALALERYRERPKKPWDIGRQYERQVGYQLELAGYEVIFNGANEGVNDQGRDLIAMKDGECLIIQAKCWAKSKQIHEKHVYQLHSTAHHYGMTASSELKVIPVLFSTTSFSPVATKIAKELGVRLETMTMPPRYPCVKCTISRDDQRLFHLPFDEHYDRIQVDVRKGEFYAATIEEAVSKGFRRAKKFDLNRAA